MVTCKIKQVVKISDFIYHGEEREELFDEAKKPSSSICHTLAWWWQTATAAVGRDGRDGVSTSMRKSRQRSASSPTTMESSDGARVWSLEGEMER